MPSSLSATPRFEALLGECAVVVVAEEQAGRGVAGHVDVGPAVVVEIGGDGGQSVPPFSLADAGRCS